jgi:hypothetical protein
LLAITAQVELNPHHHGMQLANLLIDQLLISHRKGAENAERIIFFMPLRPARNA